MVDITGTSARMLQPEARSAGEEARGITIAVRAVKRFAALGVDGNAGGLAAGVEADPDGLNLAHDTVLQADRKR
jgi:hypothetical protein